MKLLFKAAAIAALLTAAMIAASLLGRSVHAATAPQMPKLLAVTCGNPVYTYTIGAQDAQGDYAGVVQQTAACSGGGRGAPIHRYESCANVLWDGNGTLISFSAYFTASSTKPIPSCL